MSAASLLPLPADVMAKVRQAGRADILVGIPSFNNERTIAHVLRAVATGLRTHFPGCKAVVVASDGGSTDRTREILEQTDLESLAEILVDASPSRSHLGLLASHQGLPGKGWALRAIFHVATELQAPACAIVDGGLRSILPQWVQLLLSPVFRRESDFVAPVYARHKYDGTLSKLIVSPFTRALYGRRIRQPIGGDFGFSGRLAARYLEDGSWEGPAARYGINLLATTIALAEGARVSEAFLGAKVHDPQDLPGDLAPVMIEIVSTLFGLAERYEPVWREISGSAAVPLAGTPYGLGLEPDPVHDERLAAAFRQGTSELIPIWEAFLSRASIDAVSGAALEKEVRLSDEVWARILYEAAGGWRRRALPARTLIPSLIPLYLGKVAAYAAETRNSSGDEAEERLSELAAVFEREKDLLRSTWAVR